jgi:spore maturation protein CgeB
MPAKALNIKIFGLSITSSWGNGHATTYRSLVHGLHQLGHSITFFERDMPWYAGNRDMPHPPYCRTVLYNSIEQLQSEYASEIGSADVVIIGSYVPQVVELGTWVLDIARGVTAFYDIDTPVTVSKLRRGDYQYITPQLVCRYNLYLSFTGGPILSQIKHDFNASLARPLYCSVDPQCYYPKRGKTLYDLGYIGTYSQDRQPTLDELMIRPAQQSAHNKFIVAGPQYPEDIAWPPNLRRIYHLPPDQHPWFYNSQRFTLNITRADMISAGFSPSVRLFEAAACATPIISDYWPGLETVFAPGREILIANSSQDVIDLLTRLTDSDLFAIREKALARVLAEHTSIHRASQLVNYIDDLL